MSAQASVNVHVFNTIFPGSCMVVHNAGAAEGCPDCWSNITYMPGVQYNFPRVLRGAAAA